MKDFGDTENQSFLNIYMQLHIIYFITNKQTKNSLLLRASDMNKLCHKNFSKKYIYIYIEN